MYDQIREDTFYIMLYAVAIIVLLVMLQDRRRPLWPAFLVMTPLVAGSVWCVANRSNASLSAFYAYLLVLCVGIVIYMVRALRQYGRWLRVNHFMTLYREAVATQRPFTAQQLAIQILTMI